MSIIVRVSGWLTPRAIFEEGGNIFFEVAEADGCSTCRRRIDHVRSTLARKNIPAKFCERQTCYGGTTYVVLDPVPEGIDIKTYVSGTLNLHFQ